jgi:hypothetical protein
MIRGIGMAVRARPLVFAAIAIAVFGLNLFLPVAVLSVVRKPWDHFSFNPWLKRLPEWVASSEVTLQRKLESCQAWPCFGSSRIVPVMRRSGGSPWT